MAYPVRYEPCDRFTSGDPADNDLDVCARCGWLDSDHGDDDGAPDAAD